MRVDILNTTTIHIQWGPPLTPNGIITHYIIYINGNPRQSVNATSGTQNTSIGDFVPYQTVNVRLSASTMVGEGPLSVIKRSTTHESGASVYIYFSIYLFNCSISVPGPVENLTFSILSAHTFFLMWNPPTSPNGVLTSYTVLVTNLMNTTETIHLSVPSMSQHITISSGICKTCSYCFTFTVKIELP